LIARATPDARSDAQGLEVADYLKSQRTENAKTTKKLFNRDYEQ